jgi:hypothetical protein
MITAKMGIISSQYVPMTNVNYYGVHVGARIARPSLRLSMKEHIRRYPILVRS